MLLLHPPAFFTAQLCETLLSMDKCYQQKKIVIKLVILISIKLNIKDIYTV